MFVQPQAKPFFTARAAQHVGSGTAGDILHRLTAEPAAVAGQLDNLNSGRIRELGFDQISRAAQS